MTRRALLLLIVGAAAWLVPWTCYLLASLPDRHGTAHWRPAWVGFDMALLGCFAGAAWLGWRRRRAAVPVLVATATMLCCDAWFDLVLDGSGSGHGLGPLMAGAQVAIAALLALRARTLLHTGTRPRPVTVRDVEVATDPGHRRLLSRLGSDGATLAELAGTADGDVAAALRDLAGLGYVRQGRDGRWRTAPVDLRRPDYVAMSAADRARVQAWYDAKLDAELSLFRRAFRHPERYGPWSQASRSTVLLTQKEAAAFAAEYMELLDRYGALHEPQYGSRPGEESPRQMLVRFYAFPRDLIE